MGKSYYFGASVKIRNKLLPQDGDRIIGYENGILLVRYGMLSVLQYVSYYDFSFVTAITIICLFAGRLQGTLASQVLFNKACLTCIYIYCCSNTNFKTFLKKDYSHWKLDFGCLLKKETILKFFLNCAMA